MDVKLLGIHMIKKTGEVVAFQTILYRMLYRTPGKAKDGSCILFVMNCLIKRENILQWICMIKCQIQEQRL